MVDAPKDDLVERIKREQVFFGQILNGGNSPELSYEEAERNFTLLTDCLDALAKRGAV